MKRYLAMVSLLFLGACSTGQRSKEPFVIDVPREGYHKLMQITAEGARVARDCFTACVDIPEVSLIDKRAVLQDAQEEAIRRTRDGLNVHGIERDRTYIATYPDFFYLRNSHLKVCTTSCGR